MKREIHRVKRVSDGKFLSWDGNRKIWNDRGGTFFDKQHAEESGRLWAPNDFEIITTIED